MKKKSGGGGGGSENMKIEATERERWIDFRCSRFEEDLYLI